MGYATTADLTGWLDGDALPAGATRILERASEIIDELLIGAVYDVDAAGTPTDPAVRQVLTRATCAQAQYLAAQGDETGALSGFTSMTVGGVSYTRGATSASERQAARYAPQAVGLLRVAGLLPVSPMQPFPSSWWTAESP